MQETFITTNENEIKVVNGIFYGQELQKRKMEVYGEAALSSVRYIFSDLTDIKRCYIRLGFHLEEFRRNLYCHCFGFSTFEEFCEVNLGMDKGAVSRCINVYLGFNASLDCKYIDGVETKGAATDIGEKWKDYSYGQLCEMLPLTYDQRKVVTPDMTIQQIRDYKKALKKKAAEGVREVSDYNELLKEEAADPVSEESEKLFNIPAPDGVYSGLDDPEFRAYVFRCMKMLIKEAVPGGIFDADLSSSSARYTFKCRQGGMDSFTLTWAKLNNKD